MSEQQLSVVRSDTPHAAVSDVGCADGRRPFEFVPVNPRFVWYFPIKALADFAMALFLLIVLGPVILVAAAIVKVTSKGPAFYCQQRAGKNGRTFTLVKLRTMIHLAESATGAVWTQPGDPRITPFGRILRKTHVDEFPQLFNVLLGQMSLIGPRPERPEFVDQLEWQVPNYRNRLNVRPGITGLAQLQLPPDSGLESVRKKLLHDLYYIRNASPWFDCRILLFTASHFASTFLTSGWKRVRMPNTEQVDACVEDVVGEESELLTSMDCEDFR